MYADISFQYAPYRLVFHEPAGTSRGVLREKPTYFIRITLLAEQARTVYAEVPFFPGLSSEAKEEVEDCLGRLTKIKKYEDLKPTTGLSCVDFGLQSALAKLANKRPGMIFPSPFTEGQETITINGLIWMGSFEAMKKRLESKIQEGFSCIKIKIGAVNWEDELQLIKYVRDAGGTGLTVRVDANGAFTPEECMKKLEQLAQLDVHSIEQPIKKGKPVELRRICEYSPVPIALDEELIGYPVGPERSELLEYIKPAYLILKPALCFGFEGASDWIERAEKLGAGWWITSALESSVGLDAIAQFTGKLRPKIPQGLGTGALYRNNFSSSLILSGEKLRYNPGAPTYNTQLEKLKWTGA